MKYYAHYNFERSEESNKVFILKNQEGTVEGLDFVKFADTKENRESGLVGVPYMIMTLPRSPSMRKYFAYVFESKWNEPITSTEGLDGEFRTFGDGKKLGTKDLILFQFSNNLKVLDMYFVKNLATSVMDKKLGFKRWQNGEVLEKDL